MKLKLGKSRAVKEGMKTIAIGNQNDIQPQRQINTYLRYLASNHLS